MVASFISKGPGGNEIVLDCVTGYKASIETDPYALAKSFETKNELKVYFRLPKASYYNPSFQQLLTWAETPANSEEYYRDAAIHITVAERIEKSIVFTHGRLEIDVFHETKADYVTVTAIITQKEDCTDGVVFGTDLEKTYGTAWANVSNPQGIHQA